MDKREIQKKLNGINWNFDFTINYGEGVLHPFNCRKYYSYPATFIPEIPFALIEILSQKGDVVLDPFGGIGTTFMQALSLERIPFSYDINPVATTVCNTLYELFSPSLNLNDIKEELLNKCEEYDEMIDYSLRLSPLRQQLSGWFEKKTFNQMAYLFQQYDQCVDHIIHDTMKLVLLSILVTLSSQNKGWAYIADNVKPKEDEFRQKQVFDQYRVSVKTLLDDIYTHKQSLPRTFDDFYQELASVRRVFQDSFDNTEMNSESVDLVITSPPYPKMIDYVKSQRLSFGFLDERFDDYASEEIGARYRRNRRDSLEAYESSVKDINNKIYNVVKKNGFVCVVLPDYDSTDSRKSVIDKVVLNYRELGMTKVYETGRYIPSHKRTLSIQWATLVNERIYVFQKE